MSSQKSFSLFSFRSTEQKKMIKFRFYKRHGVIIQSISCVWCKKMDLEGKILQGLFSEKIYALFSENQICEHIWYYSHSKVLRIIPIKQHLRGALYCILDAEISRFSVVNRKSVVRSVVNDCLCFLHRVGELEESDTVH